MPPISRQNLFDRMFPTPDFNTLRLCSLVASLAYAGVFLSLWRGRAGESHLLYWAMSSAVYGGVLMTFPAVDDLASPLPGAALFALVAFSNTLLHAGARRFDGRTPFVWWMALPPPLAAIGYASPAFFGPIPGVTATAAMETGAALGLTVSVAMTGLALLFERQTTPMLGRRIAGIAILAYLPSYVVGMAAQFYAGWLEKASAVLALLSDQALLVAMYVGLLAMSGERAQRALREAALRDPLTGAWNRAALDARRSALAAAQSAVILIDVDQFKAINDQHGHAAGDAVLTAFAAAVMALSVASRGATLVRLGGDEFMAVLPRATPLRTQRFAEQVLAAAKAGSPGLPAWTVSVGVSAVDVHETDLAPAMARADLALYRAKARGRNCMAA